jgi:hypothetical protein
MYSGKIAVPPGGGGIVINNIINFFSFPRERSSNGTRYEKNALDLFCGA